MKLKNSQNTNDIENEKIKAMSNTAIVNRKEIVEKINNKTYSIIECNMQWLNKSIFIVHDITEKQEKDYLNYIGNFDTYNQAIEYINESF